MPQSSDIATFRPPRGLFGYQRKPTDEFLGYVAELLEQAGKRLDGAESELARYREKERSLNEALLAVAKTADAIKDDARHEAETIRGEARRLDELVAATRTRLSAFLHETLETLQGIAEDIPSRGQVPQADAPESSSAADTHGTPSVEAETKPESAEPAKETGSLVERLRAYRTDSSDGQRSSALASHSPAHDQELSSPGSL
jgi:chromosome segregation ATPase